MEQSVIILNLGYALTFIALAIREVFWLRITLTAAQISLFTYHYYYANNQSAAFWTAVFVIVNTYNIIKIIIDRRPKIIPDEIRDLYEGIFSNLTTREFLYFWNMGRIRSVTDEFLINSGEKPRHAPETPFADIEKEVLELTALIIRSLYFSILPTK